MDSSYYYYSSPQRQRQHQEGPPLPLHLCFFFLVLLMLLSLSWYLSYEPAFEGLLHHLKLAAVLSPILLLLALHWLSSVGSGRLPLLLPLPERESLHRAGGTPWGVGMLLVFLVVMVSYQS
ncbi:hypothetical protein Taro_007326 [Colocasia esculenta]|uniref:Uncharacterized protein n=1 Tax=Colocasia esculenta TaxID=4460 RepID=A0A843TV48_COLES|nr:hypothetical protein [Colocasia esculenta]